MNISELSSGDQVYVIYRNPHTQNVAQIQEATIVDDPFHPGQMSLFLFEEYYPLTDEYAMYRSYQEAEHEYNQYFDLPQDEDLY
ncbi:transcriptional regulator SplA domain-containing protein [Alteribacter natronophilus]|uniref:transcriptional regulator SplA domain-containing protein n=1 Tax=Alteribacter natronophilus TaxID=2583810 RepID=UPI00110E03C4|nr:transcriptional regulator SplA domain-containing protein [Alteribacter natronophilus]TMW70286.1 transcriptional regulator [Alteribacter natronophilus]